MGAKSDAQVSALVASRLEYLRCVKQSGGDHETISAQFAASLNTNLSATLQLGHEAATALINMINASALQEQHKAACSIALQAKVRIDGAAVVTGGALERQVCEHFPQYVQKNIGLQKFLEQFKMSITPQGSARSPNWRENWVWISGTSGRRLS